MSTDLAQYLDKALVKALEQEKKDKLSPALAFKGGKWKTRKEKKKANTKPWEEPKFNTSKEPKGEIKYYKPIPEPKEVEPVPEVDEVTVYKEAEDIHYKLASYMAGVDPDGAPPKTATGAVMMSDWKQKQAELKSYMLSEGVKDPDSLISSPTTGMGKSLTKEDILNAVESIKAANAKPLGYNPYDPMAELGYGQTYSYYINSKGNKVPQFRRYGEEERRKQGLKQLVADFTNRYGRGLNPQQFGVNLAEFIESEGYRYGYTNPEVEHLQHQGQQIQEAHRISAKENRNLKAELEALKTQMAGMVQKATPKMPRNFECNGRKFKDS